MSVHTQVAIHRSRLMQDAFASLYGLGPQLKARLIVTFTNEAGLRWVGGAWRGVCG